MRPGPSRVQAAPASESIRIEGVSSRGHVRIPNADRWGQAGDAVWVLDGATQPVEARCCDLGPREFVGLMDDALRHLWVNPHRDLGDLLREALLETIGLHTARHPGRNPPPGPAATVAMVRLRSESIEWAVLGDAGVVIGDPPRLISDNRLANVAKKERATVRRHPKSAKARLALYRAELAARNRPGGYWVLANDPEAPAHALRGVSPLTGVANLMSDGVHRHIAPSRMWRHANDFAEAARFHRPEDLISLLRRHERAAALSSDDATLVTINAMELFSFAH